MQHGSAIVAATLNQFKENGLELLVERGADVNLNGGGEFPYAIIAMAYAGDVAGTQFLIDKGADVINMAANGILQFKRQHRTMQLVRGTFPFLAAPP